MWVTCWAVSAPRRAYWVEVNTARDLARSLGSPRARARVSRAVRPSLSVTPGLKPTSTIQSKSAARGVSEAVWEMGSCRAAASMARSTSAWSSPEAV